MPDWLFWTLAAMIPVLGIVYFVLQKMKKNDD